MKRLALLLGLALLPAPSFQAERPNFVFFLIDDLGATDLGCTGSAFYDTPNIDRLAAQGMRFAQAYSACTVCSPTRASILTGRYPARLRLTDWIAGHKRPKAKLKVPDWTMHLAHEEVTIAEALKPAGYATASIGKWHLGPSDHYPEKHGFDLNRGGTDKGQPPGYFAPYRIPTLEEGPKGESLTERLTLEAIRFIEAHKDRPFLLYFPHYGVHTPLQAKPEVVEKYRARAKPGMDQKNATYAAMIESVDQSVGRVVGKLDELKLSSRTVVVFTSDNGGLLQSTSNKPLRAGKGSPYEGGVRVPLIVRWPGSVKAGSVCETPVISPDAYPTLLELAGVRAEAKQIIDGVSLVPLLRGTGGLAREALFWHYPHYHPGGATPYGAVRRGDFRLVEFVEDGRVELFNLKEDVGEANDLAASMPAQAVELRKLLAGWRASVGAQMPAPNPDYDAKGKP